MKKLLISMIVLASLVSCGKDNKVSSTNSTLNYSNPYLSGNTQAQTYAQALIAQINNPSTNFGNGVIGANSANQTCDSKLYGLISWCYTTYSNSSNSQTWNQLTASKPGLVYVYNYSQPVVHSSVNVSTKQSSLISLLNSATNVTMTAVSGGNVYYIQTSAGVYVIDTRYPIQANPSAYQTTSGSDFLIRAY